MASPQLEDGYVRIANELYQAVYKANLSGSEFRVLLFIIRQTYGFNKTERRLAISYIANGSEIPEKTVRRCINSLIEKNIIAAKSEYQNEAKILRINKRYNQWRLLKNEYSKMTTQKRVVRLPKNGESDYSKMGSNKRQNIKTEYKDRVVGNHPTIDEVFSYCESKGYSFDVEKFFSTYEATGWKSRGSDIVNWKALADVWQKTEKAKPQDQKLDCWGKPIKKEIIGRQ